MAATIRSAAFLPFIAVVVVVGPIYLMSIERVNLRWLVWLAAAVAVIGLLATTFHLTATVNHPLLEHDDEIVGLAIAVRVYGMGYMALRQPEILGLAAMPFGGHRTWGPMHGVPDNERRSSTDGSPARYERSGLTQADAVRERGNDRRASRARYSAAHDARTRGCF